MAPGGTCDRRWADSAIASMDPATGNGKRAVVGPATRLVRERIVRPIPFEQKTESHAHGNLVFNATEQAAEVHRQAFEGRRRRRGRRGLRNLDRLCYIGVVEMGWVSLVESFFDAS